MDDAAAADKVIMATQDAGLAMCPKCSSMGIPSTDLFIASTLGSELPLDFEIYRCPQKHYWRVWDDGTIQPTIPEFEEGGR
ncbi:MAG: hypothetical protein Q7R34_10095 [Dehalococcoidia bacterium]|nr:hypothetical protein [Dehalococcoidia bacterium]